MKKHLTLSFAAALIIMFVMVQSLRAQYTIPDKMKWWYQDRFGMFIHFGSYSYLGHGEWAFSNELWNKTKYQSQVSVNFNPVSFDAGVIARLAKNTGMKYLVITAKHHEGFSMWKTAVQSFKDTTGTTMYDLPDFTQFKTRDVLQELKDSCDAVGIKFGLYYSILDWSHSSQNINRAKYFSTMVSDSARTKYIIDMKTQLSELITKYHPAVFWFDGDWLYNSGSPTLTSWWTKSDGIDLYNYVISLDSSLIVNERVCRGFGLGDFECPEQKVPDSVLSRQWETCQTMNGSWGYNASDNSYKSSTTMIQELVRVVSRDGNYLLNIGPKGDGTVPAQSVSLLDSIGDWMDIYGGSIYGTTRSPYQKEPSWGFFTKKTGKLFAHVFTWSSNGLLRIQSLSNSINKIYLLNDTATVLNFTDSAGCITIPLPATAPNRSNSVIVVDVAGIPAASTNYVKVKSIAVVGKGNVNTISGNDSLQMVASITPSNSAITSVMWSVSNETIASISSTGMVRSKKNGTVTIIATANDGTEIQGKVQITVKNMTGVKKNPKGSIPRGPVLNQNYPNPFNPTTTIPFGLSADSFVMLKIYDTAGKEMETIVSEELTAGNYTRLWNAAERSSGTYFYKINAGTFVETKKLVVLK